MFLCPSTTPGIVSTSTSCSAARCFNAKLRICSCANRISSTTCCGNSRMHAAISLSERRKDAGDHLSNFSEYSRTAISPRAAISARIASTVLRTCALFSAFASADCPVLMWRIMACSPKLSPLQYTTICTGCTPRRDGAGWRSKKRFQLFSDFAHVLGLVARVSVHSSHYDPWQALAECQGELFGVRRLRRGIAWRS